VRVILLVIAITFFVLDIRWVLAIFVISSFVELGICFFIVSYRMNVSISHDVGFRDYIVLIKESLPQLGSAILMAGISRIDWILLGIFSTSAIVAEYSFAYRVYELSPFPLLIVAPVLLSRFSKYLAAHGEQSLLLKKKELSVFIRMEMIAATLIPLTLNIIWAPVIDFLTGSKYGSTNQYIFLILSFCIPFQYINNIIWSAHFAKNRLKLIFKITTITFCIMVTGDFLFIPQYGAPAAALVFLVAMIAEYLNYMRSSELSKIKATWQSLIVCMGVAVFSGYAAIRFLENIGWRLAMALPLFILLLLATGQIRKTDLNFVRQLIGKK
jgi:O-antigen/teichoic acid export membrane protein